ncbi:MAG: YgiT-type zinc finger protein [Anaerolineae bacterium]|nr:YgiT-type zinc finger protein [Anaerolineae bacterium]
MRESNHLHPQETADSTASATCRECQVGHLKRKYLTYLTWMGPELVTVPDFPAWVCDVCGYREYDLNALKRLNVILNPGLGRRLPEYGRAASRKRTDHLNPPLPGIE